MEQSDKDSTLKYEELFKEGEQLSEEWMNVLEKIQKNKKSLKTEVSNYLKTEINNFKKDSKHVKTEFLFEQTGARESIVQMLAEKLVEVTLPRPFLIPCDIKWVFEIKIYVGDLKTKFEHRSSFDKEVELLNKFDFIEILSTEISSYLITLRVRFKPMVSMGKKVSQS